MNFKRGAIVAWNDGRTVATLSEPENDWFAAALNYRDRKDETDRVWVMDNVPCDAEVRIATQEERMRFINVLSKGRYFITLDRNGLVNKLVEHTNAYPECGIMEQFYDLFREADVTDFYVMKRGYGRMPFLPYLYKWKKLDRDFPRTFDEDYEDIHYVQLIVQFVSLFKKAQNTRAKTYILNEDYEKNLLQLAKSGLETDLSFVLDEEDMTPYRNGVYCVKCGKGYNAVLWYINKKQCNVSLAFLSYGRKIAAVGTCKLDGTQETALLSKSLEQQHLIPSMCRFLFLLLYAEKYGKVTVKTTDGEGQSESVIGKPGYEPEFPLVEYRNAAFYTTMIRNTPFIISGHWRNQYVGKDEEGNAKHKVV